MAGTPLTQEQMQQALDALYLHQGNVSQAARALGLHRATYRARLDTARRAGLTPRAPEYQSRAIARARVVSRPRTGVRRLIVTSAQDGPTDIHLPFWRNLQAYAAHMDAEIIVGAYTYQHSLYTDHVAAHGRFHHELAPYVSWSRTHVAKAVAICCEMNTLPTAVRPLSGLNTYSGELHGVFPHAKVAMQPVARPKTDGAKINVTTGTVTLHNYIPKKAGMKAQFHHVFGALLIEVDQKGRTWMRHLLADEKDGSFQDLDVLVRDQKIIPGQRVESIVYGDIHYEKADPAVIAATFGYDMDRQASTGKPCLLDELRPAWQFFHDLADFTPRNHHTRNDPHFRFQRWVRGEEQVEESFRAIVRFLELTRRKDCRSVVVASNHHEAYLRWLKETDAYARDPANALFFLESQIAVYDAIRRGDERFNIFEWALRRLSDDGLDGVDFPHEEDSVVVCGIEHGMHGHLGANGARGSPQGMANMGPKVNVGHFHGPAIVDGAYVAGVCQLDMKYNRGPSSWAVAHIVTLPNGKRQIVFVQNGKWRA